MLYKVKNSSRSGPAFKILVVSFGHLCHDIYTSFLSPLLPLLIKKFALTYTSAGFISVMLRLPALLNPLIGSYADRQNLKYIVIMSPAVTGIAMCLMGAVPGYPVVVLLVLVAGISSSMFHVPSPVLVKELAGKRIGAAMSSFQIGGELARTIGPLIALGAVAVWGLEGTYRLIPAGLVMSAILYWIFRDLPQKTQKTAHKIGGSIAQTLSHGKTLYIAISGMLLSKSFTATVLAAFLPTYLTARGESLWFSGGALSILQASAIVGVLVSGTLSDKIGQRRILIILTALTPVAMLTFLYSGGWFFIVSLIMLGLFAFSSTPVILALIQKSGFSYPSIANGIYMTINFTLSSVMILLAGKLSDLIGIDSMFRVFGICSFVGIPFAFLLKQGDVKDRKAEQRPQKNDIL